MWTDRGLHPFLLRLNNAAFVQNDHSDDHKEKQGDCEVDRSAPTLDLVISRASQTGPGIIPVSGVVQVI